MSIPYRFPHFRRELLYHDLRFEGGPESGQEFPDFDLPTIGGDRLTLDQATDERPMLMYFASFT